MGGSGGAGTVFAVNTNGSGFAVLHHFDAVDLSAQTNIDGANPSAGLLLAGGKLYGTAYNGGTAADGALFSLNTDGTGFTNLYSFTAVNPSTGVNNDGANPSAALRLAAEHCLARRPMAAARATGLFSPSIPTVRGASASSTIS